MDGLNRDNDGTDSCDEENLNYKELDAYDERIYNLFVRVYRMAQIAEDFRDSCKEIGEEIEDTLAKYSRCMNSVTKKLMQQRRNLDQAEQQKRKIE